MAIVKNLYSQNSQKENLTNKREIRLISVNRRYAFEKYLRLIAGFIVDIIGLVSYAAPGAGELTDIVWAFLSGGFIWLMYQEKGVFEEAFHEEIGFFSDWKMSAFKFWQKRYISEKKITYSKFIKKIERNYFIIDNEDSR